MRPAYNADHKKLCYQCENSKNFSNKSFSPVQKAVQKLAISSNFKCFGPTQNQNFKPPGNRLSISTCPTKWIPVIRTYHKTGIKIGL